MILYFELGFFVNCTDNKLCSGLNVLFFWRLLQSETGLAALEQKPSPESDFAGHGFSWNENLRRNSIFIFVQHQLKW